MFIVCNFILQLYLYTYIILQYYITVSMVNMFITTVLFYKLLQVNNISS